MPGKCSLVLLLTLFLAFFQSIDGQRVYKQHSVLSTGNWFKIEVEKEGVYKLDLAFLNSLGLTGSIPSGQLRLFGRKKYILSESNNAAGYTDDLEELAIQVADGGDGMINGNDYVLFYSPGPHQWIADTVTQKFSYNKNLFSDKAFYFLSVGGNGKRISLQSTIPSSSVTVNSFDERFVHELDSVNLLSSGKEWFGEELSNLPGRSLSKNFSIATPDAVLNSSFTLNTEVAARAVNAQSRFEVFVNNTLNQQIAVPAVGTGIYDLYAQQVRQTASGTILQNPINIRFNFTPGSFNAQGWIDWFLLFYRKVLALPPDGQLLFRDWASVGNQSVTFTISGADVSTEVWDVSNPVEPIKMNAGSIGGVLQFTNNAQRLKEYVAFSKSLLIPKNAGRVPTQNLHNTAGSDYIIITYAPFLAQAGRLAQFHNQKNNLRSAIVTTEQVFNEFSAGIPDPTALRDFVKMYYDKYRSTWGDSAKFLLLFGKGSFDYKNRISNNTSFVPAYESVSSLDPLSTYTSDDFFGFLEDHEDINSSVIINQLDIGVGRVPVKNAEEARTFVDKVFAYHDPASFGSWRNHLNFVADDEDANLHLNDAEVLTATVSSVAPEFNSYKIYLDAFMQQSTAAGGRYPQANEVINNHINSGTLIWNYSGHGGPFRLAEEVILDQSIVNSFDNENRLPLFITATCDFALYDNPTVNSLGENLLIRPKTGAIALMTTSRVVFAYSNRIINNNYLQIALQPDSNNRYKSLGVAMMAAKNFTYTSGGDITNNRKFALLGDPAMTLGFPVHKVKPTAVNGKNILNTTDTLSATEMVTIEGEVTDSEDKKINNFNGTVFLTLFDKPKSITTLANDATSQAVSFQSQSAALFKGKVSAKNGIFSVRFRLPKDISYQFGNGKLSLYASNEVTDANGTSFNVIIGGLYQGTEKDNDGPEIKAFLNDERFVNGSISNTSPVLIVKLFDSAGINTGNSGVDHDIVATLDNDNRKYFVLNDFYETDLDSYQSGSLRFQLPKLTAGTHTLKIKAWDVLNNSNEYILEFNVVNDEELQLDHVLNYPNPFSTKTAFWFEHNKPGEELNVRVDIFSIAGRQIKTLVKAINTEGNRSMEVEWDGRDEYGERVGRGVYIYRLNVQTRDGKKATKLQRLVIIR